MVAEVDGMMNGLQGGRERGEQEESAGQGEEQSSHDQPQLDSVVALMRAMQKKNF